MIITLTPTGSSRIQTSPESQIEILSANEEKNSEFICAATGDPLPNMQWTHNGEPVNMDDSDGRFRITTEMSGDNVTMTSRLNVTRLLPTDSGRINCSTWNTVNSGGTSLSFTDFSVATLSILCKYSTGRGSLLPMSIDNNMSRKPQNTLFLSTADSFQRVVVITTEGKLRLTVSLPAAIPEALELLVRYTGESGVSLDRLVPNTFEEQEEITVEIQGTDVPFQNERFKVQVALQANGRATLFVPSTAEESDSYGKSVSTIIMNSWSLCGTVYPWQTVHHYCVHH